MLRLPVGRLGWLGLLAVALCSCGYQVVRDQAAPLARLGGGQGARVAIVTLDNQSKEEGIERLVSEALRREWLRRGVYRLEEDPLRADWVLRGRVRPVATSAPTLSSVVLALELSVTLSLSLELEAPDGERHSLSAASLSESEVFFASGDLEVTRKNRQEALRRVAGLLAERVHDAVEAEVAR